MKKINLIGYAIIAFCINALHGMDESSKPSKSPTFLDQIVGDLLDSIFNDETLPSGQSFPKNMHALIAYHINDAISKNDMNRIQQIMHKCQENGIELLPQTEDALASYFHS